MLAGSSLVVCVSLGTALSVAAQTPVGALAVDERQGDQYGWAVDYETVSAAQAQGAAGMRRGMLGGADVRPLCGLRGRPGRRQHGGGLGGIVRFGGRGPAGGAVGVRLEGRFGMYGPRMGLQRLGGRGGTASEPGRAATDPAGSPGGGLRSRRRRRPVRSANAGGDSELAICARCTVDRVSGRPAGRGVAKQERVPAASGLGGRRGGRFRRAGSHFLAVDREQHEPGGLRGVSRAVSERGVRPASAESARGVARYPVAGVRVENWRNRRVGLWVASLGSTRANRRERGWRRRAFAAGRSVPPCSNVRRATSRGSLLAGDFPAARVLCLEFVPPAGLHGDLDGRMYRRLRPGNGYSHVGLGRESADDHRAHRGWESERPRGLPLRGRYRFRRPLRGRRAEWSLGHSIRERECRRRSVRER